MLKLKLTDVQNSLFYIKGKQIGQFSVILNSKLVSILFMSQLFFGKEKHYCNGIIIKQELFQKRNKILLASSSIAVSYRILSHQLVRLVSEKEEIILISKPERMLSDLCWNTTNSLINYIMFRYPDSIHLNRFGLVHRLDKDTSGLLLLARSSCDQAVLLSSFKNSIINKYYSSVLHRGAHKFSIIRAPISRSRQLRTLFIATLQGKQSITFFRRLSVREGRGWCLVWLKPKTGRTHQIRVHCKHVGLPVIGDKKYGEAEEVGRLMLHSAELSFRHPSSRRRMSQIPSMIIKDSNRTIGLLFAHA